MRDWWLDLPVMTQGGLAALFLLCVPAVIWMVLSRRYTPLPLILAQMRREKTLTLAFLTLIGGAVALGVALPALERGLRSGSADAARGFDMIVTAPGNEVTGLLAAVYLQSSALPLMDGETFNDIHDHPRVALAAPLAFGDSYAGAPIVGTTTAFVTHLTGGPAEGEIWRSTQHALAGARTGLAIGDSFFPAHGVGATAQADAHGIDLTVTGVLPSTGTPWDHAILVPVESVWETHGLSTGHADPGQLGPPFDADFFPGTPAVIVLPADITATYGLRMEFNQRPDTMAFFPGDVLSRLYVIMGDIREVVTVLSGVAQLLVAGAVLLALAILSRLNQRRMAVLRAIGAPDRFVMAATWGHCAALLTSGTGMGLLLGWAVAMGLSVLISQQTGLSISAPLGWTELHLALGFLALSSLAALVPAWRATRAPITPSLRA